MSSLRLEDLPLADIVSFLESQPPNLPYKSLLGTPAPATPYAPPAPATSLPASPTDKQQAVLVDSVTAPTYAWLLQWSAAASVWVFLGGSAMEAAVATSQTTSSITYVNLGTVGPSLTLPRAGTYDISYEAQSQNTNGTSVSPSFGGATPLDADRIINNTTINLTLARKKRFSGLSASEVVTLQYRSNSGATTATFLERRLSIVPVFLT